VLDPHELIVALGPDSGLDTYWLTHPGRHAPHAAKIAATEGLFADETSRALYRRLWALRRDGDFAGLPAPTTHDFYVPEHLPPLGAKVRMLDCGAYVGDTIDDFVHKGVDLEEVIAFEPNPRNFTRLAERAARHAANGMRVTLLPCGLGDRLETLRFSSAGEASSALDPRGDTTVVSVAIDDVLPGFPATLVKMDIEGAEAAALRGAAKLIARHKPRLAISAYHRPEDLWHLPELVRTIRPDYRLYLSTHAYNGFETVLYAV
jgi:FkbM family methyltransferase